MNSLQSISSHKIKPSISILYNTYTYTYFKLEITNTKNFSSTNSVQFADFYFIYNGVNIDMTSCTLTNPNGNSPGNETVINLKDNNPSTKFLDFNIKSTGVTNVIFQFTSSKTIDSYKWRTANDATDRDPMSWKLYGSDNGINWIQLHSKINYYAPDSRYTMTEIFIL